MAINYFLWAGLCGRVRGNNWGEKAATLSLAAGPGAHRLAGEEVWIKGGGVNQINEGNKCTRRNWPSPLDSQGYSINKGTRDSRIYQNTLKEKERKMKGEENKENGEQERKWRERRKCGSFISIYSSHKLVCFIVTFLFLHMHTNCINHPQFLSFTCPFALLSPAHFLFQMALKEVLFD